MNMKKRYEKPAVESELVFETLASGCGLFNPDDDINCDPGAEGSTLNSY